ncbi:hypothetical protein BS47DRAFT_1379808 [Hydnum rufescens UP504]|uniref:Meiotically up-regulated protein Msb1/Mug8 domain-containing protein n=1 Tax=Hydnum rufescens UP504 TaxID=1448309 RepID=A0A9P6B765_9AGAM|nr:hypothetical protein BS47DRAFT_1379808 [Hydnum rufescens UP504]
MPSIFSRSKTSSSTLNLQRTRTPDEFGRVHVAAGSRTATTLLPPSKEKGAPLPALPDGSFLPLLIPRKKQSTLHEYGYIGSENEVFLGLEEVTRLVDVVSRALSSRGVTTPFLFSTQALDVSSSHVRSLVRSFLATCDPSSSSRWSNARTNPPHAIADAKWREEHVLKWGLARLARVTSGFELRGFLDFSDYLAWRIQEEENNYPPNHFLTIFNLIQPQTHSLFKSLFTLFSRFCAYSSSSGLTPQTLATHFGPLIFGLGAPSLPFGPTYSLYLRSVYATEHLLLSSIVNQDYDARHGVELPTRLKNWIRGYPNMIPKHQADMEKNRPGVRTFRVASVRRNVRLYSSDLVHTATIWAGEGHLERRKEWTRVVPIPHGEYSQPKYTDDFKKRLDLPTSFEPKMYNDLTSSLRPSESTSNFSLNPPYSYRNPLDDIIARSHPELTPHSTLTTPITNEDRFRISLICSGFDLGESARRSARSSQKRETISWNDFSLSGFERASQSSSQDSHSSERAGTPIPPSSSDRLSDALKFSVPVDSPSSWSEHTSDLTRKLRKQQKVLPPFGWDTSPVAGREWIVEEGMIQTCSGWVDWAEGTFREANWALRDGGDPRTSSQWFLFEEFVPREYREQLQNPKKKSTLFSSLSKQKAWKPAPTLNGQPYTGRPRSPNPKDFEFDAMLRHSESKTKIISLSSPPATAAGGTSHSRTQAIGFRDLQPSPVFPVEPYRPPIPRATSHPKSVAPVSALTPLARLRVGKPRPMAAEWDSTLEFETRTESDTSIDSHDGNIPSPTLKKDSRGRPVHQRQRSKDDAWVDILILESNGKNASGEQRLAVQREARKSRSKSDPEQARAEIQRAMETGGSFISGMSGEPENEKEPATPAPFSLGYHPSYAEEEEEVMRIPRVIPPAIHIRSPTRNQRVMMHYVRKVFIPDISRTTILKKMKNQPWGMIMSPPEYDDEVPFPSPATSSRGELTPRATTRMALPSPPSLPRNLGSTEPPKAGVSNLIQIFQQKEEAAVTLPPPNPEIRPSRLPVSVKPPASALEISAPLELFQPRPSGIPIPSESADATLTIPEMLPPLPELQPRVPSPARYVHGAPLHNVLEDDEDEE